MDEKVWRRTPWNGKRANGGTRASALDRSAPTAGKAPGNVAARGVGRTTRDDERRGVSSAAKTRNGNTLDLFSGGLGLEPSGLMSMELGKSDHEYLSREFRELKTGDGKDVVRFSGRGSDAILCIRASNGMSGKRFLNVDGNPISFVTGQNIGGSMKVDALVKRFYQDIEEAIRQSIPKFRFPPGVREAIESLNISLRQIGFAGYSHCIAEEEHDRIATLLKILNAVYATAEPTADGGARNVAELLGISVHWEKGWLAFQIRDNTRHALCGLTLYDKYGKEGEAAESVKGRLRFDLKIFTRRLHIRKLHTLASIDKRYEGDYTRYFKEELEYALRRIDLRNVVSALTYPSGECVEGGNERVFDLVSHFCLVGFADEKTRAQLRAGRREALYRQIELRRREGLFEDGMKLITPEFNLRLPRG